MATFRHFLISGIDPLTVSPWQLTANMQIALIVLFFFLVDALIYFFIKRFKFSTKDMQLISDAHLRDSRLDSDLHARNLRLDLD